jgi:hypothetical protein
MLISSTFCSKPSGVYWVVPGWPGTAVINPRSSSNFQKEAVLYEMVATTCRAEGQAS